ncbi:MAG: hypothetical protein COA81_07960 [Alphaproteobacteria bacterium]|nr:MAG: hypothetical protein COA81_07960 [Alphaproteobacteria bacterium]
MHKTSKIKGVYLGVAVALSLVSTPASATIVYDANVTPDIIFGSGNSNGSFTVDRSSGVELGLRAKIPFTGTLHSNGDGTYSYTLAEANPKWNFDWTVNTDYSGTTGNVINSFTYEIGIDFDPGIGTDFFAFDPITPSTAAPFYDHSIGTNSTGNGGGAEVPLSNPPTAAELAAAPGLYQTLIGNNNVLQQSWRHAFFTALSGKSYDPTIGGTYDIYLAAFANGVQVARTDIQVTVPEPAPFALMALSLLGMGLYRRKRR